MQAEKGIKSDLLGTITKKVGGGDHEVDVEKARAPIDDPDGVIRLFCINCDTYHVITQQGAQRLVPGIDTNPESLSGHHIESETCDSCIGTFDGVGLV